MSFNILSTNRFGKELKRLAKKFPSLKMEFKELIEEITKNPKFGTYIGNNCYKIRIAIESKAKDKSGGARAITYVYVESETVYLLTIYDKSEKENLKPSELKMMVENLELE
jgi:mRNA-degrading endonuclease RelE of RelBE toxin-antitoxin system